MLISVFTPTYRSTATLRRSYESLCNQTYKNFEWIIVDDFSNDNNETIHLIESLKEIAPFPVKTFYFQENHFGGKSMAKALEFAEGELFVLLDHDDQFKRDALSAASLLAGKYFEDENIGGIVGRCENEKGEYIGKRFLQDIEMDYEGHLRYSQSIFSEFCTFFRTSILKKHVGIMKKGFTYGVLMATLSQFHKMVFTNKVFRIYDTSVETSYTNSTSLNTKFPSELVEMNLIVFDIYKKYFVKQPVLTFKQLVHTNYLIRKYGIKPKELFKSSKKISLLLALTKPVAVLKHKIRG